MVQRFLLPVFGLFLVVSPLRANIGSILPAGDLEDWATLSLGLNGSGDRLSNDAQINGDVAVSGNGNIALTNNATIDGDVYFPWGGGFKAGAGTLITGSQNQVARTLLNAESNLALNLSRAAGLLTPTRNLSMIDLNGSSNLTLSGAPGETVVLSLRMIRMRGDSTLTLQGSANTTYVINVNRGFSLTDASRIVLSGGLDWNDVVFNVRGRGAAVTIAGTSNFQGILLASRRTVQLRDSAIVRGEVIADALLMQGTTQINHPAVVSP
jgi:cytoskeletal protein CcmA (bactofilin family)